MSEHDPAAEAAREEVAAEAADLEARLRAASDAQAAAKAVLEPEGLEALRERVEAAELEARNASALAEAVKKHGKIGVEIDYETAPDGRIVIVKRPHPAAFKRFQDLERVTVEETEQLVRPCVVYPDHGAYDTLADRCPGIVSACAVRVSQLAGVRKVEKRGK